MTRKDYVALAEALRVAGDMLNTGIGVHEAYVVAVADVLAADNPRFDRDRFYKAAGF